MHNRPSSSIHLTLAQSASAQLKKARILKRRVSLTPDNGAEHFRYAECLRALGQLDEAKVEYSVAAKLNHQIELSLANENVIETATNPQYAAGDSVAPNFDKPLPQSFFLIDNYLSEKELNKVWELYKRFNLRQYKTRVLPDDVDITTNLKKTDGYDHKARRSVTFNGKSLEQSANFFTTQLRPTLNQCYKKFSVAPPVAEFIEINLTTHIDGDFFAVHRDQGPNHPGRLLSFVYYFSQEPKAFSGGDLLLFDYTKNGEPALDKYTRIQPVNNRLVVFQSEHFHQVSTIVLDKEDKKAGRHTLNGWHNDQMK